MSKNPAIPMNYFYSIAQNFDYCKQSKYSRHKKKTTYQNDKWSILISQDIL